jgi:protein Mpv17
MSTGSPRAVIENYDVARTLRFVAFGMAMGPIIGRWILILERQLPMRQGLNKNVQLAKRVLADQVIMCVPSVLGTRRLIDRPWA